MKIKKSLLALAPAALAVVVAGCGGGNGGGAYGSAPPAAKSAGGATVAAKASKLGNLLVDAQGRTLYLFEADKTTASTCYSACASIWPPLTTTGAPKAGSQLNASLLGTTKRSDGQTEVTYHGHPLYYYAGDTGPGKTSGQALNQFGAKWYVVAPTGNKIDTD